MAEDAKQCEAITKDGKPCQCRALPDQVYCWAHSPQYQAARLAGSVKGGKGKSKAARLRRLMPQDLREIFDILQDALLETYAGNLDHRKATAMAALAGAMCKVLEAGELTQRVDELQERQRA